MFFPRVTIDSFDPIPRVFRSWFEVRRNFDPDPDTLMMIGHVTVESTTNGAFFRVHSDAHGPRAFSAFPTADRNCLWISCRSFARNANGISTWRRSKTPSM